MQKTWQVTASSRGLGRKIAETVLATGDWRLATGDNLVATTRDKSQLDDLLARYGDRVRSISLDVTDPQAACSAEAEAVYAFGRLDLLVNNAGYADVGAIEDMSEDVYRARIDTNFYGVVNLTWAALPFMREQHAGHIIQISSIGGRVSGAGLSAHQAAKWAVGGFSEVLAKEVTVFGIKITVAAPGGIRTNWAGSSTDVPAISEAYQPVKAVIGPMIERLRVASTASSQATPSGSPRC